MIQTGRGGSMQSYVIIGAVMILLLLGATYIVRRGLSSANNGSDIAVQDDSATQPSKDSDDGLLDDSGSSQSRVPDNASQSQDSENQTVQSSGQSAVPSDKSSTGIPQTGPSSILLGGLMLSILSAVVAAYLQSRQTRARIFDLSVK